MIVDASYAPTGETVFNFTESLHEELIQSHPSLIISGHVTALTGDRIAVACALLAGESIGDYLSVGRDVSQRVGHAIRRYLKSDNLLIDCSPIQNVVHTGSINLVLSDSISFSQESQPLEKQRRLWFSEVNADRVVGSLFSYDSLVVSTNSRLVCGNQLGRLLAVPVLMAQMLSVSRITIPIEYVGTLSDSELESAKLLLHATEIQLVVEGPENS